MLDGSVNANMANSGGKSIGRSIGSMFKHNRSLVHVDLSHTGLTKEDCKDIVEGGLRRNHHVLGLHMVGNEMDTDALGFLSFPGSHPSVSHIFMRIHSTLETGVVRDKRIALRSSSNCWICEGWSQVRFTFDPQKSSIHGGLDLAEDDQVFIHFSFDNFDPDLMFRMEDGK